SAESSAEIELRTRLSPSAIAALIASGVAPGLARTYARTRARSPSECFTATSGAAWGRRPGEPDSSVSAAPGLPAVRRLRLVHAPPRRARPWQLRRSN